MNKDEINKVAAKLANELLCICDDSDVAAYRIQFKYGTWPNAEISGGGMNEAALARFFRERLAEYAIDRRKERVKS